MTARFLSGIGFNTVQPAALLIIYIRYRRTAALRRTAAYLSVGQGSSDSSLAFGNR